ncbi:MAG: ABC transporter substrate-binding protein [Clostridia bacterium]|nr:ABC transporter substrate-binding protein [Clostridia bacterium]
MKKILSPKYLVVFFIFIFSFSSCTQQEPTTISFGYQPFGSNLTFFVAMEKGFFKEQGVEVKAEKIISANDAANAVVNGLIVGNATIPLNVLLNIEENKQGLMKIFMVKTTSRDHWSDYLLVKKGSNITSINQLKGKKVGGYPGSAQKTLIKIMLKKYMDENDITIVEMPPNTQLQGLDSGQIEALLTYDDLAITALQNNIAQVLEENPIGKHVIDPLYGFPYVLSTKFTMENPKTARKVRDAMYKAADFIKTNEKESRYIMAKWVGTNSEIADKVNLWAQVKSEEVDKAALQKLADLFYEGGVTKKRIDTNNLYLTENDLK